MGKAVKSTRPKKRHRILKDILKVLLGWIFVLRFNFKYQKVKLKETPAIVLMNHNSDYDPIFAGLAVQDYMYYVSSEHVIRMGFLGKLVKYIFDPIIRVKGSTEARAAREIMTTVRNGMNVCMFAEGGRSYNGETGAILSSTGKLIRRSGCGLLTYRLRGGYFTTPRWGRKIRRGLVKGEIVNFYTKEQVAAFSDEEISRVIAQDLYVDAYEDQKKFKVRYRGSKKDYAEGIEVALYLCPNCNRIGTVKSKEDRFFCNCGLDMRISEYGWLEDVTDKEPCFTSVLEWDKWQRKELEKKLKSSDNGTEVMFFDEGQTLYEISENSMQNEVISGTLLLFRNRLELIKDDEAVVFHFEDIDDIELTGRMNIAFSTKDKKNYEVRSSILRSSLKYKDSFRIITDKRQKAG